MTDQDLLGRATQALREETRPHDGGMNEALSRLRWAAPAPARRYRKLKAPVLAAWLGLGGAVAWASTTGHLKQWVEYVADYGASLDRDEAPGLAEPDVPRTTPQEPTPPTASLPSAASTSLADMPPTPTVRPMAGAPWRPPEMRPSEPSAAASPPMPSSTHSSEARPAQAADADAAYRRAHMLHFKRKNYVAALVAWDEYMRVAPAGDRWLPEARFNRAVALHRLGRHDEARSALEPFAHGMYGGYRRDDAKRLIEQGNRSDRP